MFVLEKDGRKQEVASEIQKSAFLLSGWSLVEDVKGEQPSEQKPKVGRPAKK